ncbi:MAG: hypothetical protein ABI183_09520 [Polyangiaceae bacterium]
MFEHFRDGGIGMFPILIFGVVLLAVAIRYAVKPQKKLVPLLYGLGILTMASGGLGFVTGLITTAGAIGSNPDFTSHAGLITIIGFGESLNNVAFSLIFVTLAALAACLGAMQIARTPLEGS